MRKLFISYRRDDSAGMAGRIYDRLLNHFGSDSVFMDVDSIPYGVDFRQHLTEAVAKCHVLLAVIGDRWLTIEHDGKRRLDDPSDFVRIEIEAALSQGIPLIPVLLGRTPMPKENELPRELHALVYRNAAQVDSGPDFHPHIDRLIRKLTDLWSVARTPSSAIQHDTQDVVPPPRQDDIVIVDKQDVRVELATVTTESIDFTAGDLELTIPVRTIASIRVAEKDGQFVLQSVDGQEWNGTSKSTLEGEWELGKYSVLVADIRSADFAKTVQSRRAFTPEEQPDGFVAKCTTRSGVSIELNAFVFVGNSYSGSPYNPVIYTHPYASFPLEYRKAAEIDIPFHDIDMINFADGLTSRVIGVSVALRDGRILTGSLAENIRDVFPSLYNQRFSGATMIGTVAVKTERILRIVLDHTKSKNVSAPATPIPESPCDMVLKTWDGTELLLVKAQVSFRKADAFGTSLTVKIGNSTHTVEPDKIGSIVFPNRGESKAQMTLTGSGKVLDVSVESKFLSGILNDVGRPATIAISALASCAIRRHAAQ